MRIDFFIFFKGSLGHRGISLVEILVTISILAILGGIALPSYQQYRKSTVTSSVKMELAGGAKAYILHQKLAGDFCATFDEVGFYPNMDSKIFETGGFIGFSGEDCNTEYPDVTVATVHKKSASVTPPTGCTLKKNEFIMGAHTQVQGLSDLHYVIVDSEGKVKSCVKCGTGGTLPSACPAATDTCLKECP